MRFYPYSISWLALALGLLACDGQSAPRSRPDDVKGPRNGSADTTAAGPAGLTEEDPGDLPDTPDQAPADMDNSAPPPASGSYRLLGILDPDMGNMVAFALKVPRDWQVKQSFTRQWRGAVPENKVYLSLTAPDGKAQIEYLPATQYVYADGPMAQNLRMQKQQMGMPTQMADNELPPMPPVQYIKQVLLPRLAQNGLAIRNIGNEQETPRERDEQGTIKERGSVDGTLPNGNRVRVECRTTVGSQQVNGDTYYSWGALPSLTQSVSELMPVFAHTLVAQQSIVNNPTWLQKNRDLQNRGAQLNSEASRRQHEATMGQINANTAAMTAAHNQRMANIQQQGAANTARYNDRMAAMDADKAAFDSRMASGDRQQEIRVDAIRGESKYQDPTTGQRVKVEDGYNHVYRSQQDPNVYLGTNTPIEAGKVDWQELQKVSLKDY